MLNLSDTELKNIYRDSYVKKYHQKDTGRLKKVINKIKFDKKDIVADFACGNGLLAALISNKVSTYTGVDFSEAFIKDARERNKHLNNASFTEMDIIDFCKQNPETYTKAFAMDFSEHIYDEQFLNIFQAIKDSLVPGGELYIHTPNRNFVLEILKSRGFMPQIVGHIAVRNFDEYKKLLDNIGFSKIENYPLSHYVPVLKLLHILSYIPLLGKYFKARILIKCLKQ